jgi:hypothetical protein
MGLAGCSSNGGCAHHHHHHHLLLSRHWSLPRPHVTAQQIPNTRLWYDTTSQNPSAASTLLAAQSTTSSSGVQGDGGSNCQSNSSSLSNILDRLETLSVASIGYETCVWKRRRVSFYSPPHSTNRPFSFFLNKNFEILPSFSYTIYHQTQTNT